MLDEEVSKFNKFERLSGKSFERRRLGVYIRRLIRNLCGNLIGDFAVRRIGDDHII